MYFGKKLNLKKPATFNEKLQWLKLHDRKDIYTKMVDKIEAKEYVGGIIGREHIIRTLGVWNSFDEIDFEKLPEQFVLKCTHDSGDIVICRDKSNFDFNSAKQKLTKGLRTNFYFVGREWPYKNVKPRIIAEEYMSELSTDLSDYKIHCFNGIPLFILVCKDRFSSQGMSEDFFDAEWNHIQVKRPNHHLSKLAIDRPTQLNTMLEYATLLSKDIPFLRVDFYIIKEKVYFGELTFYPASGFARFDPEEYDELFGEYLKLPNERG